MSSNPVVSDSDTKFTLLVIVTVAVRGWAVWRDVVAVVPAPVVHGGALVGVHGMTVVVADHDRGRRWI